MLIKETLIR